MRQQLKEESLTTDSTTMATKSDACFRHFSVAVCMSISTAAAMMATGASTAAKRGSGFGDFFRHHGWLSPGIRLFRRIGLPAKAAWISVAFVLPLAVMLVLLANV